VLYIRTQHAAPHIGGSTEELIVFTDAGDPAVYQLLLLRVSSRTVKPDASAAERKGPVNERLRTTKDGSVIVFSDAKVQDITRLFRLWDAESSAVLDWVRGFKRRKSVLSEDAQEDLSAAYHALLVFRHE
jgi:hypothetical protein